MRISVTIILSLYLSTSVIAGGWSIDKPVVTIPDTPLEGRIFGKKFVLGKVDINDVAMTIQSKGKTGLWPDSELIIFVGKKEILKQKKWIITPASQGNLPHIHMKFARPGKDFPGTFMYVEEYSMKLEFTKISKTQIKGKLHLSLPDYKHSYLIGSFTAEVK
jgi:hypothetical protein